MYRKPISTLRQAGFSLAVVMMTALPSAAGPIADFNGEMADAYAAYRSALFMSNMNKQDETLKSINGFSGKWQAITARWGATPPPNYSEDPLWQESLGKVSGLAGKAAEEAGAGKLAEAHEVLEGIRDVLGELRERNGVVAFSDHVNAYHARMEDLLLAGYKPEGMDAATLASIREQAGVLDYLAGEIARTAPAALNGNDEFAALLKGLQASVSGLRAALDSNDPALVIQAVGTLKPAYSKLFLKFG